MAKGKFKSHTLSEELSKKLRELADLETRSVPSEIEYLVDKRLEEVKGVGPAN